MVVWMVVVWMDGGVDGVVGGWIDGWMIKINS